MAVFLVIWLSAAQLHHLAPDSDQAVRDMKGPLMRTPGAILVGDASDSIARMMMAIMIPNITTTNPAIVAALPVCIEHLH